MTPFAFLLIGVLAIFVISLLLDASRRIVIQVFHLIFLGQVWLCQRLLGLAPATPAGSPGWLRAISTALGLAATTTGGVIATAARIITYVLAILAILIAVGVAFQNLVLLTTMAVLAGSLVWILRLPFMVFKLTKSVADKLSDTANVLFWVAILMLFLPTFTTSVGMTLIITIMLCGMILLSGDKPWLKYIVKYSTGFVMILLLLVLLFAPARRIWTAVRYGNLNQQTIAATDERIGELEHKAVVYGGLSTTDRAELNRLKAFQSRQESEAQSASAHRSTASSSWRMPRLRQKTWVMLLLVVVVAAWAWPKRGQATATATHSTPHL